MNTKIVQIIIIIIDPRIFLFFIKSDPRICTASVKCIKKLFTHLTWLPVSFFIIAT